MILGYHYFWKHPNSLNIASSHCLVRLFGPQLRGARVAQLHPGSQGMARWGVFGHGFLVWREGENTKKGCLPPERSLKCWSGFKRIKEVNLAAKVAKSSGSQIKIPYGFLQPLKIVGNEELGCIRHSPKKPGYTARIAVRMSPWKA